MPARMSATDYSGLVGGHHMTATAVAAGAIPQGSMTGRGAAAVQMGDQSDARSMTDLHRSPSTWFVALLVATALLARAAGFVRGR